MNKFRRWFGIFERRVDRGWELTKADPMPMITAHLIVLLLVLLLSGCGNEPVSNEYIITESAKCEENGFGARIVKSTWDSEITGVQCYTLYEFTPVINEFTLEDGTRCVSASTRAPSSARAGFSGISCDWKNEE